MAPITRTSRASLQRLIYACTDVVMTMPAVASASLHILMRRPPPCAGQAKPPKMVNLFLPGGTSHHLISNALAGAMRGRGWRTTAILADFDARSLAAKRLLDRGLETIVFQTPPKSSEQYQVWVLRLHFTGTDS